MTLACLARSLEHAPQQRWGRHVFRTEYEHVVMVLCFLPRWCRRRVLGAGHRANDARVFGGSWPPATTLAMMKMTTIFQAGQGASVASVWGSQPVATVLALMQMTTMLGLGTGASVVIVLVPLARGFHSCDYERDYHPGPDVG